MRHRIVSVVGSIAVLLGVSRALAAETPGGLEKLAPESERMMSDLKKLAGKADSTPAPSTPTPMAYTPAVRTDGRRVVAIDIGHTAALPGATSAPG